MIGIFLIIVVILTVGGVIFLIKSRNKTVIQLNELKKRVQNAQTKGELEICQEELKNIKGDLSYNPIEMKIVEISTIISTKYQYVK